MISGLSKCWISHGYARLENLYQNVFAVTEEITNVRALTNTAVQIKINKAKLACSEPITIMTSDVFQSCDKNKYGLGPYTYSHVQHVRSTPWIILLTQLTKKIFFRFAWQ